MATLVVLKGVDTSRQYSLEQAVTEIGRNTRETFQLHDPAVSRRHFFIFECDGEYYIEDLGSANGTFVNGQVISGQTRLQTGDQISLGSTVLLFVETANEEWLSEPDIVGDLSSNDPYDSVLRDFVCKDLDEPLVHCCKRLHQSVSAYRLVFHPFTESSPIQEALLSGDENATRILAEGFHRLIVLDVGAARDSSGRFDIAAFYAYAYQVLETAFDLHQVGRFHEQDLMQVLMDEDVSLICLLNSHLATSANRRKLRSLTQEKHHALIAYRGLSLTLREEDRLTSTGAWGICNENVQDDFDDQGSVWRFPAPSKKASEVFSALLRNAATIATTSDVLRAFADAVMASLDAVHAVYIYRCKPESSVTLCLAETRGHLAPEKQLGQEAIQHALKLEKSTVTTEFNSGYTESATSEASRWGSSYTPIATLKSGTIGFVHLRISGQFTDEELVELDRATRLLGSALQAAPEADTP